MLPPDMNASGSLPEFLANSADFLTAHEREQLWDAALVMVDSRGLILRLTAVFGRRVQSLRISLQKTGAHFGGEVWEHITHRAQDAVEDTLWHSFSLISFGLSPNPSAESASPNHTHRVATALSGAASGFIGLPGVLFDIPFTTATILRSIAEIARDAGEDLATEDARRACLEVLAFGGPGPPDDENEIGYWATRAGMNHFTISLLIKSAAARFGLVLSEKLLAQTVPVAGALAGGALNYAFTSYYQDMARVTFCLRTLDRRTGEPLAVRQYFAVLLKAARGRRRITRRRTPEPVYLPC
ncbi:MAG TPA: EcsC family protein [Acidocella sp.]|nr:MAG: hypothetical protein B7Z81_06145 [Acidocella sp. 20-61-6]HQT47689.1 EcsC family protein [Acidocella sp.]